MSQFLCCHPKHFKMSKSDQSEFYYPDENENIISHEEIQKKQIFVIIGADEARNYSLNHLCCYFK